MMQLGVVGLGRMGGNIVRRLVRHGHRCVAFDQDAAAINALGGKGVTAAKDLAELVRRLEKPRAVWLMLPSGAITEDAVTQLAGLLDAGDTVIDGGNSYFKDDVRRAGELRARGIHYVDCGTSGGVWGLQRGYCLMIGGEAAAVERLDPIFAALAPGPGAIAATPRRDGRDPRVERGYMHCGPAGAGHFVKMVHNGIEYGLMQAYAEGFAILQQAGSEKLPAGQRFDLDLPDIAELWRRGSVVSSWLLDLTAAALAADAKLDSYSGHVEDSGEGRWTVQTAVEEAVAAPVLSAALYARFRSRQSDNIADKMLSAMRQAFGGHLEPQNPTEK
jgi:6-phosphogluconate dehydrogenase